MTRLRARLAEDRGSAMVEFLGAALILLVPLLYLVLVLAQVQSAAFAAEGAAREAGRHLARAASAEEGLHTARLAVGLAFADQGHAVDAERALTVACSADPCLTPGAEILVEVAAEVELPLVPAFARDALPALVPVSATHVVAVPQHRGPR